MSFNRVALRYTVLVSTILLATACTAQTPDTTAASSAAVVASSAASDAVASSAASAATSAAPDVASAAESVASDAAVATTAAASTIAPPKGLPPGPTPVEGTDYTVIDTPDQPTGDKVQVTEVFGYGCPHCNALQPHIAEWEKKLPSDVDFTFLPAAFGGGAPHCWDEFARAFFTAQALGVQTKSHDGIYKEVWDQHRFNTCDDIPALYKDYGVDPKVFASTMQSFAINAKIGTAHEQVMHWGVDSTPTIVVDGKYRVQELVAGGPEAMLHTVDWLIAKQRPEHPKH